MQLVSFELRQTLKQPQRGDGGRHRKTHHRLVAARQPALAAIAEQRKRFLRPREKPHALRRQAHTSGFACEKPHPHPALEARDLPRHRAMSDAAFLGRGGKRSEPGSAGKGLKCIERRKNRGAVNHRHI